MQNIDQNEINLFLDALQRTGAVNMFGASTHVSEAFDISKKEAREYVINWMQTYSERHPK